MRVTNAYDRIDPKPTNGIFPIVSVKPSTVSEVNNRMQPESSRILGERLGLKPNLVIVRTQGRWKPSANPAAVV